MEHVLSKKNRQYWMGIAILAVFCYHLLFPDWNNFAVGHKLLESIFLRAEWGVDIFLFVSAYGLCYSYSKNSIKQYYYKRIQRLFPIYIIFYLIFVYYEGDGLQGINPYWGFFAQVTGLSCFFKYNIEWYIPALILLYLTFPMLFKGLRYLSIKEYKILVLLVFILSTGISTLLIQQFIRIHFAKRLYIVVLGILTYFYREEQDEKKMLTLYATAAIGSLFSVWYGYIPIVLYSAKYIYFKLPFRRMLSFLGHHSLELYLAQHISNRCYAVYTEDLLAKRIGLTIIYTIIVAIILWVSQVAFSRVFYKNLKIKHFS